MYIDDEIIANSKNSLYEKVWIPETCSVVLGSSNQDETECFVDVCKKDNIPILKRKGGGGTVLLHSGCLIIGIGCWVKDYYNNTKYFSLINQSIIKVLESVDPVFKNVVEKGISDLALGDQKIAGTSLFRSRHFLLYQGSLLIDPKKELIAKYLRHPSKEPDYRKGKSHLEFITGLQEIKPEVGIEDWQKIFTQNLGVILKENLGPELSCHPLEGGDPGSSY